MASRIQDQTGRRRMSLVHGQRRRSMNVWRDLDHRTRAIIKQTSKTPPQGRRSPRQEALSGRRRLSMMEGIAQTYAACSRTRAKSPPTGAVRPERRFSQVFARSRLLASRGRAINGSPRGRLRLTPVSAIPRRGDNPKTSPWSARVKVGCFRARRHPARPRIVSPRMHAVALKARRSTSPRPRR